LLAEEQTAKLAPAQTLLDIRGIGPEFAAILWSEGLFRHFENRRQIAAYAGLAPTPWQSGAVDREQGVSKAGNLRLRTTQRIRYRLRAEVQNNLQAAATTRSTIGDVHDLSLYVTAVRGHSKVRRIMALGCRPEIDCRSGVDPPWAAADPEPQAIPRRV
jgi:hypothetical protein